MDKKITEKELREKGIRSIEHEGENYFLIADINPLYPNVKYTPLNVRVLKFEGREMKLVKAEHIEKMNDFDLKIQTSINHKPKP